MCCDSVSVELSSQSAMPEHENPIGSSDVTSLPPQPPSHRWISPDHLSQDPILSLSFNENFSLSIYVCYLFHVTTPPHG